MNPSPIQVAVGVMQRNDAVLLAQRPVGKPYAGWWEFPGGKIEALESPAQALARELHEELGVRNVQSTPWVVRHHRYPHADVQLFFRRVVVGSDEPHPCEGQTLCWEPAQAITVAPLLPASVAPLMWLQLPACYLISCAAEMGVAAFERALRDRLDAEPAGQPLWLQWREPALPAAESDRMLGRLRQLRAQRPLRVLASSRHPASYARAVDGVHLTAHDLAHLTARPALPWVAASCHDIADLQRAAALGCDFAVMGPVCATPSHPGQAGLGWAALADTLAQAPLPVYALGGLSAADLPAATAAGAHGVAMMRAAWR